MNNDLKSCCEYKEGPYPPSNTPTRLSDRTGNITDFANLPYINSSINSSIGFCSFPPYGLTNTIISRQNIKVKKVIVQPDEKVVVVIFENGDKSIVKCGKDDTFSIENGVAIAISKYVLGSGAELKRLVKNATIQGVKKEVKTFINNSIGEVPTHCNALESDKIEEIKVGDVVNILNIKDYKGGIVEYIAKGGEYLIELNDRDGRVLVDRNNIEKFIKIDVGDWVEFKEAIHRGYYLKPDMIGQMGIIVDRTPIGMYVVEYKNISWIVDYYQLKLVKKEGK